MSDSAAAAAQSVTTVEELLAGVELDGVRFMEISGKNMPGDGRSEEQSGYAVDISTRRSSDRLEFRLRGTLNATDADYTVDFVLSYKSDVSTENMSDDLGATFVEREVLPTAWPFLRAEIAALAARMGNHAVMLGIIRDPTITRGRREDVADELADWASADGAA